MLQPQDTGIRSEPIKPDHPQYYSPINVDEMAGAMARLKGDARSRDSYTIIMALKMMNVKLEAFSSRDK